jgi:hypothetical protein
MLDILELSQCTPLLGETFRIFADGAAIEAELVQAAECGPENSPARRKAFSLIFSIPADAYLPQQMYRVEHASLALENLFLVPIQEDSEGKRMQAIFN